MRKRQLRAVLNKLTPTNFEKLFEQAKATYSNVMDRDCQSDSIGSKDVVTMSGISDLQSAPIPTPDLLEATLKHEGEGAENFDGGLVSFAASVSKDKPSLDLSKGKSTIKGGKKKRKKILQKADAAGTTSDLYNACKGPEEKKETVVSTDSTESTSNSTADVKQAPADTVEVDAIASEKGAMSKAEPDDWEDSDNGQQVIGRLDNHDKDEAVITAKKYSRDFLLKFAEQYNDLPKAFQITSDTETLMSANFNISHQASFVASISKDKPSLDLSKGKSTIKGGKKKRKKILRKADAAGTTSDLYSAYKGPEEKKETVVSTNSTESTSNSTADVKQAPADAVEADAIASEKAAMSKAEPDDWEDAADVSTPKLEVSDNGQQVIGRLDNHDKDEAVITAKKYSRDFLLKFAEQYNDLPKAFQITSHTETLMSANFNIPHQASSAASISKDKPSLDLSKGKSTIKGGKKKRKKILQKADAAGTTSDLYNAYKGPEEKKETVVSTDSTESTSNSADVKQAPADAGEVDAIASEKGAMSKADLPKAFQITSDTETLMSANFNISHHVERDSYPSPGRIVDRPSGGSRIDRHGSCVVEEGRWNKVSGNFSSGRLRATNIQKGLIPSPHTPLLMMHKAEKKYEVGKVVDEEEAKQRQLRAILNKLTPTNFEKLFEQVKAVNIDNAATLVGVVSQIFDRTLMEPIYCEIYVNFCCHLAGELPDFNEDNEKITFKRVLLNKCQWEFERGEKEQEEEANKADEEGEIKQSAEEREEKRVEARRRMLGNIRLIGELYKKKMLTERIMHACIHKLLGQYQDPGEEDLEALCKLMSTIGEMIDHKKVKEHMDAYFDRMKTLSNNMNLSSRIRFMLKDAIDLRKNKWQQRNKVEGPKKIEEVHKDAAQELQAKKLAGRVVLSFPNKA
ncbi:hypothetical protein FH972_011034 [Carpinus fangiana]|uniref:MIF4G domain-containing protein n=1 Tax=Carpinus fangiana TaxID=176857 RepID=A0A660KRV8_9ROSI|nr:hypothetical protein FH972_011034 [Carpinus fangiana]